MEFDDCTLKQAATTCNSQFTPSKSQCQGEVSLNSLLKHFFPKEDIALLTNGFIQPEKFDCTKFYINTCKGQFEFQATAREDIDVIPNRLRVSDASLILRLNYRVAFLFYAAIEFEMDGVVNMESKKLAISCSKGFDNLPVNIIIKINQLSAAELAKLFSVTDFTSANLPPAVEELRTLTLTSVSIRGFYHSDGYFEFILKGKPETSTVFQHSQLYMLIQKKTTDEITAGLVAHFSSASFQEILSGTIGKDIFYRIPILWYGKLNIALQTSANGIARVKDETFNRDFRFFATRGMAIAKGLRICVEFPFQDYANAISTAITEKNLPLRFLFTGIISQKRIVISFDTGLMLSVKSSFLIFMSQKEASSLLTAFKDESALCRVTKMELVFGSSEIRAYLSVENSLTIVQGLPRLSQFEIVLTKSLNGSWKIGGHGRAKIAGAEFETDMKSFDGKSYSLIAKAENLSSYMLVETLAKDTGLFETFKKFEFFNFDISKVLAKSNMNSELNFRCVHFSCFKDISQQSILIIINAIVRKIGQCF